MFKIIRSHLSSFMERSGINVLKRKLEFFNCLIKAKACWKKLKQFSIILTEPILIVYFQTTKNDISFLSERK